MEPARPRAEPRVNTRAMDAGLSARRGETEAHRRLKRRAVLWAQAQGYSACAVEVSLPQCRYRADVAAYRGGGRASEATAIFECKQVLADLRRDNCCTAAAKTRLETMHRRREILERHLRVHYPTLRGGESLFPEFDSHNFEAIGHHGYARVVRELGALQKRMRGGTKFEYLTRYRCANLFWLVLPNELYREAEVPLGWGALVEVDDSLVLRRKPEWQDNSAERRLRISAADCGRRDAPFEPSVGNQFRAGAGRAAALLRRRVAQVSNLLQYRRQVGNLRYVATRRLWPVISGGCGIPRRKSKVGATSARIPFSTRKFFASSAT